MASQRVVGEASLSSSGPSHHHHNTIPYAVFRGLNPPPPTSFINQEGSAFDFGELEEAIVLQGVKINNNEAKTPLYAAETVRPAATLEMFPSWPTRLLHATRGSSRSGEESTDSGSAVNTLSSRAEGRLEAESPISRKTSSDHQGFEQRHLQQLSNQQQLHQEQQQLAEMANDGTRAEMPQAQHPAKPTTEKVYF